MKKVLASLLALSVFGAVAYAGVSGVRSNGSISGVPSYQVQCSSGRTVIIYKKNGTWYTGGSGHMGHKYDSWSTNDVAQTVCR
jgi:hypothetical protein